MQKRLAILSFLMLAAPAAAQRTPETVPAAWRSYATALQRQIESVVAEEAGEPALRLRAWLTDRAAAGLVLRLWADADGRITRVDPDATMPADAAADLRQVLVGRVVSDTPPADLAWPITLRMAARPAG